MSPADRPVARAVPGAAMPGTAAAGPDAAAPAPAVGPDTVPRLWRVARVGFDEVRQRPVLLYPEGAVLLNETGAAILRLVDGRRTVREIAERLAGEYHAPDDAARAEILRDVTAYLAGLVARELVHDR